MSKNLHFILFSFLLFVAILSFSQTKSAGPIIEDFGKVWEIDSPSFSTDSTQTFKVVFDIMDSPLSNSEMNRSIETAARFLNMHAQAGVPLENMKVALVFHSKAAKDILKDKAYSKRYLTNNPNNELIKSLLKADVNLVLCGQSANSRNIEVAETIDGVQLSLSAMTALIQLQHQGYQLIKF